MDVAESTGWEEEFDRWLEPFLARMGRVERRRWAPVYLRGLLGSASRKNVEQMAAEVAPGDVQQLHHFVSASPWPTRPVQEVLVQRANTVVGGPGAVLIIDDTGIVKKGTHSVGVARQYCGELGKRARCQVLVTLTLARGEVPVPVSLRLYLPEEWTEDPERLEGAGVPEAERSHRTKWQIALGEVDFVLEHGAEFDCVTVDAEYGKAADFRRAMNDRGLRYAAGILPQQHVYPEDVELTWPEPSSKRGRPRKHPVPSEESVRADETVASLGEDAFHEIAWRKGTKGELRARFAATRVRVASGPQASNGKRLPSEEPCWLVCEWRRSGEKKYYLCNHAPNTSLLTIVRHIKARWSCEQAHKQLKNEVGLDHLECRSWRALHHHALTTAIACCFLQDVRTREKNTREAEAATSSEGPAAQPQSARDPQALARDPGPRGGATVHKLRREHHLHNPAMNMAE